MEPATRVTRKRANKVRPALVEVPRNKSIQINQENGKPLTLTVSQSSNEEEAAYQVEPSPNEAVELVVDKLILTVQVAGDDE